MKTIITGQVIVLGNNIDTDQIYPGRYLELVEGAEIGRHCLEGVDPNIPKNFRAGDIVIAGTNFGCGSSREHAPISLINMGASLVIADSFARIFFRNSINLELPLIICEKISQVLKTGDKIEVNIETAQITVLSTGETLQGEVLGDHALSILRAGGIKPIMRAKYAGGK